LSKGFIGNPLYGLDFIATEFGHSGAAINSLLPDLR
jgi:hypothetical protein